MTTIHSIYQNLSGDRFTLCRKVKTKQEYLSPVTCKKCLDIEKKRMEFFEADLEKWRIKNIIDAFELLSSISEEDFNKYKKPYNRFL